MSLSIVEPHDENENADWDKEKVPHWETAEAAPARIPRFEGQDVAFTKAKLTSASNLEIADQTLRLDEIVRLYCDGRVVRVDHVVNDRTGHLERVHTIKVIDAQLVPFEESRD